MAPFCQRGVSGEVDSWWLGSASGWCKVLVLWGLWLSHVAFALVGGEEATAERWRSSLSSVAWWRQRPPGCRRVVEGSRAVCSAPQASGGPGQSRCFGRQWGYLKLLLVSCVRLRLKALLL